MAQPQVTAYPTLFVANIIGEVVQGIAGREPGAPRTSPTTVANTCDIHGKLTLGNCGAVAKVGLPATIAQKDESHSDTIADITDLDTSGDEPPPMVDESSGVSRLQRRTQLRRRPVGQRLTLPA